MSFVSIIVWIIVGSLAILKIYNKLTTGRYKGNERLDGKSIIVTGANAGIGFFCAKDFAKRGAKVIMVCRDMKKAENAKIKIIEETGNKNISLKHIDFLSFSSVRKCANEILQEEGKIDILLNNAGAGGTGFKLSEDGINKVMQANYFGPFLFTNILLGKIIQSAPSRIVNVSSLAHRTGKIELEHLKKPNTTSEIQMYSDSKLGNIYFTNELARKLRSSGVTVNSLHPGVFYSEIGRNAGVLYNLAGKLFIEPFFKSIEEGAQTSIFLCVSSKLKNVTGKYFSDCKEIEPAAVAKDMERAKMLWEASEKIVNLLENEKHY